MLQTWALTSLRLSLALSALVLFNGGCEEDAKKERCVPGETLSCQGADGCAGTQVCEITGRLTLCQCDVGVAGSTPSGSEGGSLGCTRGVTRACFGPNDCEGVATCDDGGTFGACRCPGSSELPNGSRANVIGAACRTSADCGTSLFCWAESATGVAGLPGGPTGGYCTARCQLQPDCASLEAGADCMQFADGTPGLCFGGCVSESPAPGEVKCLGRTNVACWSYPALSELAEDPALRERGLCLPKCESDRDCPGRRCNLGYRIATCDELVLPGEGVGAPCSLGTDCLGHLCRALPGGGSACSGTCTIGGASSCSAGQSGSTREAACVLPLAWEGGSSFGPGDIGLCAELCDVSADCRQAGFDCVPSASAAGRVGTCVFRAGAPDAGAPDAG